MDEQDQQSERQLPDLIQSDNCAGSGYPESTISGVILQEILH